MLPDQGWVFAMAESIFARRVEKNEKKTVKTGNNWQQLAKSIVHKTG